MGTDIESLAQHHAQTIRKLIAEEGQGDLSEVIIGGYSHGGWVAVRTAELVQLAGIRVPQVFILDSLHPGHLPEDVGQIAIPFLLSNGVPEDVLKADDLAASIKHWMVTSGPTEMSPTLATFLQDPDKLAEALKTTDANLTLPPSWGDGSLAFLPLKGSETELVLFNATIDHSTGLLKDDSVIMWPSPHDTVTVIDVDTDHMKLLDDHLSLDGITREINDRVFPLAKRPWFEQLKGKGALQKLACVESMLFGEPVEDQAVVPRLMACFDTIGHSIKLPDSGLTIPAATDLLVELMAGLYDGSSQRQPGFEVAGMYGHRYVAGRTDYLMQWRGAGNGDHASWVEDKSAKGCGKLLSAYWASSPKDLSSCEVGGLDIGCTDENVKPYCNDMECFELCG